MPRDRLDKMLEKIYTFFNTLAAAWERQAIMSSRVPCICSMVRTTAVLAWKPRW